MKRQLLAALGVIISAGSVAPTLAVTPPQSNGFSFGGLALACSVKHDIPALHITNSNNLRKTFKKGERIQWTGSQGQRGEFILQSDLPFFKTIDVKINSDFESCTAAVISK